MDSVKRVRIKDLPKSARIFFVSLIVISVSAGVFNLISLRIEYSQTSKIRPPQQVLSANEVIGFYINRCGSLADIAGTNEQERWQKLQQKIASSTCNTYNGVTLPTQNEANLDLDFQWNELNDTNAQAIAMGLSPSYRRTADTHQYHIYWTDASSSRRYKLNPFGVVDTN